MADQAGKMREHEVKANLSQPSHLTSWTTFCYIVIARNHFPFGCAKTRPIRSSDRGRSSFTVVIAITLFARQTQSAFPVAWKALKRLAKSPRYLHSTHHDYSSHLLTMHTYIYYHCYMLLLWWHAHSQMDLFAWKGCGSPLNPTLLSSTV